MKVKLMLVDVLRKDIDWKKSKGSINNYYIYTDCVKQSEDAINEFIKDKKIIEVNVTKYDDRKVLYTIMYEG